MNGWGMTIYILVQFSGPSKAAKKAVETADQKEAKKKKSSCPRRIILHNSEEDLDGMRKI